MKIDDVLYYSDDSVIVRAVVEASEINLDIDDGVLEQVIRQRYVGTRADWRFVVVEG